MDVIVRSNNDPVNDMTATVSGNINDLNKVIRLRLVKVGLVSDCNGLSKLTFMSPTRQTNPARLLM